MVKFDYDCPVCGTIKLDDKDYYLCRSYLVVKHYEEHLDELKQVNEAFPHGWQHALR